MNNFFVIANTEKEYALKTADLVEAYLKERGMKCRRADGSRSRHIGLRDWREPHYTDDRQIPDDTECIIVLGGDGTLLQAARDTAGRDIPLIGINNGHLGYLTQVSGDGDIFQALERLFADDYTKMRRLALWGSDDMPIKFLDQFY